MWNIHSGEVRAGFPAHSSDEVGEPTSIRVLRRPIQPPSGHGVNSLALCYRPSLLRSKRNPLSALCAEALPGFCGSGRRLLAAWATRLFVIWKPVLQGTVLSSPHYPWDCVNR